MEDANLIFIHYYGVNYGKDVVLHEIAQLVERLPFKRAKLNARVRTLHTAVFIFDHDILLFSFYLLLQNRFQTLVDLNNILQVRRLNFAAFKVIDCVSKQGQK